MRRYSLPLLACPILGLAPFLPEPHIVGKLRWVLGGARGMAPIGWFDLALHGAPFVWLVGMLASDPVRRLKAEPDEGDG